MIEKRDDRMARAESLLERHGLSGARITPAGESGEIAAIRVPPESAPRVAALVREVRALGFKYVAVDLTAGPGRD